ncbi:hypothetical protein PHYBLDRAFT_167758 [Phycomyces blakesleeanus NRRL 1555(-)]|uniref:Uncharacterized protein n=1 Tax=Phycomyces blakesleeanus (strain ATCC 8743b / DSM 1359 / FGSC 10004 / NBRC 33097 / NRRL 1555) TaxID=763407 RepID=A0A162XEE8_PHYB8|nr:hypothetical protein PHYBLDRAFT_167758 [Phycomyces blakesleeanus NRRL 1555(-)]OAD74345.1 hypothetical protein PHYBLDRAFT_167758 [Phycomyces blakesleeanus NRRL 1555(-)]|eukprot:XP_018292385.1 hypothetical protein PHYBLDRAFT_167758 [Phycomyces blakesleeanus NRRL 1555(-)]
MRHKVVFQDDGGHLLLEYYFLQPAFCQARYQICVSLFDYTLSDISRMYLYSKTTGIVLIILKNMFISILCQVFSAFIPAIKVCIPCLLPEGFKLYIASKNLRTDNRSTLGFRVPVVMMIRISTIDDIVPLLKMLYHKNCDDIGSIIYIFGTFDPDEITLFFQ